MAEYTDNVYRRLEDQGQVGRIGTDISGGENVRYSEQQPNLVKMAKDLYPTIVKQLEEKGIKPQRALSDKDLSRIVDQSPSVANRLDQILEVGGFPSESSTRPMSKSDSMMMAELMNMQPVGSSGIEGMLASAAGMSPQGRMTRLLADKKLYSQMVEDSQKVLRNIFGRSNNPKLDPMDFNQRFQAGDFPLTQRADIGDLLVKYNRRKDELNNITRELTSLEKAMGQMPGKTKSLTDNVFDDFMKKSGMRDGGITGLLRRP
jgi:hypothetical protein